MVISARRDGAHFARGRPTESCGSCRNHEPLRRPPPPPPVPPHGRRHTGGTTAALLSVASADDAPPSAVRGVMFDPPPTPDGAEDGDGWERGGGKSSSWRRRRRSPRRWARASASGWRGRDRHRHAPAAVGAGVVASAAAAPGVVPRRLCRVDGRRLALASPPRSSPPCPPSRGPWRRSPPPPVARAPAAPEAVRVATQASTAAASLPRAAIPAVAPVRAGGAGLCLPVEVVGVVDVAPPQTATVGAGVAAVAVAGGGAGGGRRPARRSRRGSRGSCEAGRGPLGGVPGRPTFVSWNRLLFLSLSPTPWPRGRPLQLGATGPLQSHGCPWDGHHRSLWHFAGCRQLADAPGCGGVDFYGPIGRWLRNWGHNGVVQQVHCTRADAHGLASCG